MAKLPKIVRDHLAKIGKKGGSSRSAKKRAASRINAEKAWRARWADRPQREL